MDLEKNQKLSADSVVADSVVADSVVADSVVADSVVEDSVVEDSEADSEAPRTLPQSSLVHTHTANLYH
jgi:hypothetical protein